jgi:hypothetical protein
LITFLSPGIATSINTMSLYHYHSLYCPFMLGTLLSVCTCWFHTVVTLISGLVSSDFGTCSYRCLLPDDNYNYYYHHHHLFVVYGASISSSCFGSFVLLR